MHAVNDVMYVMQNRNFFPECIGCGEAVAAGTTTRILAGLIQVKQFGSTEGNLPLLQRFVSLDVHLPWQNLRFRPSAGTWSVKRGCRPRESPALGRSGTTNRA
jgi:hypothetical protein